jgi:hypothetical protein
MAAESSASALKLMLERVKAIKAYINVYVLIQPVDRKIFEERTFPHAYDVLVYQENGHYYAKDVRGNIICSDSPSACLQEAVDYLQKVRGGRILVKAGTYYPTTTVNIPDGIKLILEGEGDSTVFRYTDSFTLFLHTSNNPTWTSVLSFKNFKIDRSGSGANRANIIYVLYALYDEYDNITIVDDYRGDAEDVGLYGRNSIVSIVRNCRFFNKASPVWFHSFLVHIYGNYARNTGLIGFAAGHLLPESVFGYKQPPGYPLDGLVVIENNACIDCGRTDEAYGVDNESVNPYTYGTGIIRNNLLITQDYSVKSSGIACVNVDSCIIENNYINAVVQSFAINAWWKNTQSRLVVVRNNKINVTSLGNIYPIHITTNKIVVEGNDITATITADGSDKNALDWGLRLEALDITFARNSVLYTYPNAKYNQPYFIYTAGYTRQVIFRENEINVSYPQDISTLFGITFDDSVSKNAELILIENNNIKVSSGRPLSIGFWGTYETSPLIRIVGNKFYSGSYYTDVILNLRTNDTVTATILGNTFKNVLFNIYTVSQLTPTIIITDIDINPIISPYVTVRYRKRNSGSATFSGDGTTTQFRIQHNLEATPNKVIVTPASRDATGQFYVTADNTYIYVNYLTAPPSGTNNVVLNWYSEI